MSHIENWEKQLHKGVLELLVLQSLLNAKKYGGEILQDIQSQNINIQEGTLYPLLNRMERNDWLSSEWVTPVKQGHPRRYYQLTDTSKTHLPNMQKTFKHLFQTILQEHKHG